jgi:hypothetical protein
MAQYGRPVSDLVNENWENQASGTTNLYQAIDEATASDADYIQSAANPSSSDAYVAQLTTTLEDPVSNTGHVVRWRRKKSASGGAEVDLAIELREGYVNETTQGSARWSTSDTTLPTSWTSTSDTLTTGEADSITDYTDLSLRFTASQQ